MNRYQRKGLHGAASVLMPRRNTRLGVTPRRSSEPAGLTLIEMLVVIAIIALLLAMLMPALSQARQIGYRVQCLTNVSNYVRMQAVYAAQYNGWYCTPSTNGYLRELDKNAQGRNPLPTNLWDSISPLRSINGEAVAEKGIDRWLESRAGKYNCPANIQTAPIFGSPRDLYTALPAGIEVLSQSYGVNPGMFRVGSDWNPIQTGTPAQANGSTSTIQRAYSYKTPQPIMADGDIISTTTAGYRPRMENVKAASHKVMFADAFRAIGSSMIPDISADARTLDGWVLIPAYANTSHTYGKQPLGPTVPANSPIFPWQLSYRHFQEINAGMFDGAVRTMSIGESRNAKYWWPAGTKLATSARPAPDSDYPDQRGNEGFVIP